MQTIVIVPWLRQASIMMASVAQVKLFDIAARERGLWQFSVALTRLTESLRAFIAWLTARG
jgi:hypothetical protein